MKKLFLIMAVLMLAAVPAAHASEITGTLSTGSSTAQVNQPSQQGLTGQVQAAPQSAVAGASQSATGATWNVPAIIKAVLIGLLLLEILVLLFLPARRKKVWLS